MLLANYDNGNCSVTLTSEGTKIRRYEGEPRPTHPDSVDLKITDYCDAGCAYCHERSTKKGQHGDKNYILSILEGLPAGVEIAIGGGNPLDHPELTEILQEMRLRGLIPNITVNEVHVIQKKYNQQIRHLKEKSLIFGIGVSLGNLGCYTVDAMRGLDDVVYHVIAGVNEPFDIIRNRPDKVLILGYKQHGRGLKFYSPDVDRNIRRWNYWLHKVMRRVRVVSFDNLAIKQLNIAWRLGTQFQHFYMGDDGQFTMYVDGVKQEYAISSTSNNRYNQSGTIKDMFNELQ